MTLLEENLCLLERCCLACKVRKDSLRFNRNVLQRLPLIGDLERIASGLLDLADGGLHRNNVVVFIVHAVGQLIERIFRIQNICRYMLCRIIAVCADLFAHVRIQRHAVAIDQLHQRHDMASRLGLRLFGENALEVVSIWDGPFDTALRAKHAECILCVSGKRLLPVHILAAAEHIRRIADGKRYIERCVDKIAVRRKQILDLRQIAVSKLHCLVRRHQIGRSACPYAAGLRAAVLVVHQVFRIKRRRVVIHILIVIVQTEQPAVIANLRGKCGKALVAAGLGRSRKNVRILIVKAHPDPAAERHQCPVKAKHIVPVLRDLRKLRKRVRGIARAAAAADHRVRLCRCRTIELRHAGVFLCFLRERAHQSTRRRGCAVCLSDLNIAALAKHAHLECAAVLRHAQRERKLIAAAGIGAVDPAVVDVQRRIGICPVNQHGAAVLDCAGKRHGVVAIGLIDLVELLASVGIIELADALRDSGIAVFRIERPERMIERRNRRKRPAVGRCCRIAGGNTAAVRQLFKVHVERAAAARPIQMDFSVFQFCRVGCGQNERMLLIAMLIGCRTNAVCLHAR